LEEGRGGITRINPRREGTRGKKRERQESPIDISDSSESDEGEKKVARPSSRAQKKVKLDANGDKDWDALEKTLLAARTRKVEVQTKAQIEMAKFDAIIEETERKVKSVNV
jgi:rRNA maturation endonuclease Nob1